jgi:hypothetical protein
MARFTGPSDPTLPAHVQLASSRRRRMWVHIYNAERKGGDEARAAQMADRVLRKKTTPLSTLDVFGGGVFLDSALPRIGSGGITYCEILSPGNWVNEASGAVVAMPQNRIDHLLANTLEWMADGKKVKVISEHRPEEPEFNRGFGEDIVRQPNGRLLARAKITDRKTREAIEDGSIAQVSVGIVGPRRLSSGKWLKEVIHHIALTNDAVVTNLEGFRARLSSGQGTEEVAVRFLKPESKEAQMPFPKEVLEALGLKEGAADKDVHAAIAAQTKERTELSARVKELEAAPKPAPPAAPAPAAEGDSDRIKVLLSSNEAKDKRIRRLERERVEKKVADLLSSGRVLPAQKVALTKLLSAQVEGAVNLSTVNADGSTAAMDLEATLEEFLSAMPEKALFERITGDQDPSKAQSPEFTADLANEKRRLEAGAADFSAQGATIDWLSTKHGERTKYVARKGTTVIFQDQVQV